MAASGLVSAPSGAWRPQYAHRLGINMTILREALRRLEGTGTVELRHRSGIYVGPNLDRTVLANPTSPGRPPAGWR